MKALRGLGALASFAMLVLCICALFYWSGLLGTSPESPNWGSVLVAAIGTVFFGRMLRAATT